LEKIRFCTPLVQKNKAHLWCSGCLADIGTEPGRVGSDPEPGHIIQMWNRI